MLRRTGLIGGDRRANRAEHSWHIAVIAMLLEAAASPEALLANAADRLMPLLQNHSNDGGARRTAGVDHDAGMVRLSPIGDGAAVVWEYVPTLLAVATAQGFIQEA